MIEDLVSRAFAIRNAAHLAHWATKSFSEHKALGNFYEDVIDKIDGIVEAYQGWFGLIGPVPQTTISKDHIAKQIGDEAIWIADHRAKLSQGVTLLQNLIDDLLVLYSSTHYKLVNLK
jgi:hypothetical protein